MCEILEIILPIVGWFLLGILSYGFVLGHNNHKYFGHKELTKFSWPLFLIMFFSGPFGIIPSLIFYGWRNWSLFPGGSAKEQLLWTLEDQGD